MLLPLPHEDSFVVDAENRLLGFLNHLVLKRRVGEEPLLDLPAISRERGGPGHILPAASVPPSQAMG